MYLAGPLHHVAEVWITTIDNTCKGLGPEVFMHFSNPLRSEDFSHVLQAQMAQHLYIFMGLQM
jgi:hypothetical protein